jgi:signal peptide peptidase SppA
MNYSRVILAAYASIWAIQPEKLEGILAFLDLKASGGGPTEERLAEIKAAAELQAARAKVDASTPGSVAVLPLYGIISHRASMMSNMSGPGGTSTEQFGAQFRQAVNNPSVKAIVIDVDSPGGTVDGVAELANEIYQARDKKPITAVANCTMASAAYWIACSASEIVASPSAQIGSIGVFCAHKDISKALDMEGVTATLISAGKYKTEGNAYEPLTAESRASLQAMVDEAYGNFTQAVAKGRKSSQAAVQGGYGEGRVVSAQSAVASGLADRVATLDQVLAKYGASRGGFQMPMAEGANKRLAEMRRMELAGL